jgi:hypothetical protein
MSALDQARLRHVVAVVTLSLGVTASTQLGLPECGAAVVPQPSLVVARKRAGHELRYLLWVVARRALPSGELLFVFVALKTALHRWEQFALRLHRTTVTRHALASNAVHRQVALVLELDLVGRRWGLVRRAHRSTQQRPRVLTVAGRTARGVRRYGFTVHGSAADRRHILRRRRLIGALVAMAACARQTRGLPHPSTAEPRQVELVGKARVRAVMARENDRQQQRCGKQPPWPASGAHRRPPTSNALS